MGYINFGTITGAGDMITFGEGSTERMRIDGNGNVGIGVETAQDRLHIAESVRLDKDVDVINDNYGRISFSADDTVDYCVRFMHYQGTAIYDSMIRWWFRDNQ